MLHDDKRRLLLTCSVVIAPHGYAGGHLEGGVGGDRDGDVDGVRHGDAAAVLSREEGAHRRHRRQLHPATVGPWRRKRRKHVSVMFLKQH